MFVVVVLWCYKHSNLLPENGGQSHVSQKRRIFTPVSHHEGVRRQHLSHQEMLAVVLEHDTETRPVLMRYVFLNSLHFLHNSASWEKAAGATSVSEQAHCQVVNPSLCVCKQINSPSSSLIPSESSLVSCYAALHMAGKLPNPSINLVSFNVECKSIFFPGQHLWWCFTHMETIELKPPCKHRRLFSLWANIGSLVLMPLDLHLRHRLCWKMGEFPIYERWINKKTLNIVEMLKLDMKTFVQVTLTWCVSWKKLHN